MIDLMYNFFKTVCKKNVSSQYSYINHTECKEQDNIPMNYDLSRHETCEPHKPIYILLFLI